MGRSARRERVSQVLGDGDRGNEDEDDVDQDGVLHGGIDLHGVEGHEERDADTPLEVALDHREEEVEGKEGEEDGPEELPEEEE